MKSGKGSEGKVLDAVSFVGERQKQRDSTDVQLGLEMDFCSASIFFWYFFYLEVLKRRWGNKNGWGETAKCVHGGKSG